MLSRPVPLRAGCKINLYLRVGERLPNGYHELETLLLPLAEPHDILEIVAEEATGSGLRVEFSVEGIDPERNTLTKAWAWFAGLTGFAPALRVMVHKHIPHGAGLGGGSADAAVFLGYLRERAANAGYPLPEQDEFLRQSAAIGADVPFFLLGGAAKASGVGEKLVPVTNPCAGYFLLLLCPDIHVSTAWAFAALDLSREEKNEKTDNTCLTLPGCQATYSLAHGAESPGNDFEDLVFIRYPELSRLHSQLCEMGAALVRMSGTGSSLFALFHEREKAETAIKSLASAGYKVYMQKL